MTIKMRPPSILAWRFKTAPACFPAWSAPRQRKKVVRAIRTEESRADVEEEGKGDKGKEGVDRAKYGEERSHKEPAQHGHEPLEKGKGAGYACGFFPDIPGSSSPFATDTETASIASPAPSNMLFKINPACTFIYGTSRLWFKRKIKRDREHALRAFSVSRFNPSQANAILLT